MVKTPEGSRRYGSGIHHANASRLRKKLAFVKSKHPKEKLAFAASYEFAARVREFWNKKGIQPGEFQRYSETPGADNIDKPNGREISSCQSF
jgi:hypothetical protein